MIDSASLPVLNGWDSFYVIVGSSGAALTGLMFVVIAIVADSPQNDASAINAFGTPTMVHFCVALLVSAVTSAPWHRILSLAITIAAIGVGGITYGCIVIARAVRQTGYKPVFQDWLWYMALPLVAHLTFVIAGLSLPRLADAALFFIGAATLLLLLIGIHNAWDTVTYLAIDMRSTRRTEESKPPVAPPPPPAASPPSAARR